MIIVTGGAGFIGSHFVRGWLAESTEPVVTLDRLTYAGHRDNLASLDGAARHELVVGDIGDRALVDRLLARHRPRAIVNFAAETHVDRSIHGAAAFVDTNVRGTFTLLESVRAYLDTLAPGARDGFRFLHVSTDEVYGALAPDEAPSDERRAYAPNSPYAASKAAADHLVRAWHQTYGVPVLTSNCSNNYGPFQYPEKLIPLVLLRALAGAPLPLYGDGLQVRDWLYVEDHCRALRRVLEAGRVGETYNIGARDERTNLEVVRAICGILDELRPRADGSGHDALITFVADRPGHDRRYALDASKAQRELGWTPTETLASGLRRTVAWFLANDAWVRRVATGELDRWMRAHYAS